MDQKYTIYNHIGLHTDLCKGYGPTQQLSALHRHVTEPAKPAAPMHANSDPPHENHRLTAGTHCDMLRILPPLSLRSPLLSMLDDSVLVISRAECWQYTLPAIREQILNPLLSSENLVRRASSCKFSKSP